MGFPDMDERLEATGENGDLLSRDLWIVTEAPDGQSGFVIAFFIVASPPWRKGVPMPPIKHYAPPPGVKSPPLSFAARTGDLLFISGIPGFDEKGALADGFEAQFGFVVANIRRVLDEAGATFRDLVKVNVLLTRASDVATMNVLYASAFGPAPYPARTTCVVAALPDPKMLIEIEGVAQLKS
jgi:2-iminobutanoate/2-iminopropanoate deaminase